MTLELKKNVLINDLQYIYKHLFNNTQCKIHNRHTVCHNTGHIIIWFIEKSTGLN